MNQKIRIDLEEYKVLFRDGLEKDHARILDFLRLEGKGFELSCSARQ